MLIDTYLPDYHFNEFHCTTLNISSSSVYEQMVNCNLNTSVITRILFWLRGMPKRLYTIGDLKNLGFIKLAETPGEEVLYGIITNSATFSGCQTGYSGPEFISKSGKEIIKAVINFRVENKSNFRHHISTETRVWCGSNKMKKNFSLYWFIVKPFSRLIRKLILNQIKTQIKKNEKEMCEEKPQRQ